MHPNIVRVIVFLVLGGAFLCFAAEEEAAGVELRSSDSNQEKWHAVEPQTQGNNDWIPAEGPAQSTAEPAEDQPVMKRRRPVRKRKRRPQNPDREYLNDDTYPERLTGRSRLRRPQRLDQRREQWREEMLSEEPFRPLRPYNRRRLYPKYDEPQNNDDDNLEDSHNSEEFEDHQREHPVERIRDPYTALSQESNRKRTHRRKYGHNIEEQPDHKEEVSTSSSVDLKTLLKQSGGISLSELLQQKNLSLADLLNGEQHAISALTAVPEHTYSETTPNSLQEEGKYTRPYFGNRRLPSMKKHKPDDSLTTRDSLERPKTTADTKSTFPVEATTERRIFVPSHPKYYTSVDYKPNMKDLSIAKTPNGVTTTPIPPEKTSESISIVSSTVTFSTSENPAKSKNYKHNPRRNLPTTLAKLKNQSVKTTIKSLTQSETPMPPKAYKIDLNELFGFTNLNQSVQGTTEGPMKISVDIEKMIEKSEHGELQNDQTSEKTKEDENRRRMTSKTRGEDNMHDDQKPELQEERKNGFKLENDSKTGQGMFGMFGRLEHKGINGQRIIKNFEHTGTDNGRKIIENSKREGVEDKRKVYQKSEPIDKDGSSVVPKKEIVHPTKEHSEESSPKKDGSSAMHKTESMHSAKVYSEEMSKSDTTFKNLSAKDEIMEILSDSVSRENLTRVLELRNMTLEELLEQRERGSSQRHLADIFHNQTKEPEPQEELIVDEIVKTVAPNENAFLEDTFPDLEPRPDNNVPKNQAGYFEAPSKTRESRQNLHSPKKLEEFNFINHPLFRTTTGKSNEIIDKFGPIWRQAYTNLQHQKFFLEDKLRDDDLILKDEAQRIEEIENKLAEAVNGALNVDVMTHKTYINEDDESEFFRLPYGVRSAIIASAIIVGISLLVFLTIFIIFKWTQKQRKHLSYSSSFSSAKIKAPILESPYQRRIFGSIMNATLGRKKRLSSISCSEPHSFQEYLWENDRKPFQ